jgi:hypothetical protein
MTVQHRPSAISWRLSNEPSNLANLATNELADASRARARAYFLTINYRSASVVYFDVLVEPIQLPHFSLHALEKTRFADVCPHSCR